jgi:transposase
MEATGVYWKPVWNILSDGRFDLILANAAHIKAVPGRKTDINDAMWIADLVACGLIRPSYVPAEGQAELRSLLRTRKQLCREQASPVQRIQKTLEEANINPGFNPGDILGVSGRRMIEAMIAGVRNPHRLAGLADRRLKASPKQLYDALHGRLTDHHRFLLQLHLGQYDALSTAIEQIDRQVDTAVAQLDEEAATGQASFRALIALLCTIPGVSTLAATSILAEIDRDMSRFPSAGHLRRLGRSVPRPKRERRQAPVRAPAQRRSLAQDHARPVRLGGQAQEGQLPTEPSSISSAAGAARKRQSAPWPPRS